MHIENTLGRYYVHKDFWGKEKKYIMFEHVKLKELCTVNQGLQIPISKRLTEPGPNRYFYITVQFLKNNIENYYIENPPIATTCNKDEILMVRTGNTGQVITGVEGCFHNNFFKVKPNDRIIPKYLYYVLKSDLMYKRVLNAASGTTIPDLKHSSFYELDIPLPMIETQKKISEMLECIDKKIENNEAINRNLLDQANAFFQSWFVEYEPFGGSRPDDWKEGILDDIIEFSNGYAFKSNDLLDAPDPERDCYHVFKQGHINRGGGFNITGTKSWYPKELATNLHKYVLHKGDVLMAMTDMKDNVAILGNTAIMEIEGEYIVNQRVGLLRPTGIYGIQYPYISLLTNSYDFLKDLRSRANSGVQVNLSSNEIRNSLIYIAPESVNKEFNELVMPLFEAMIVNDIENLRLVDLRDGLLPKLMSGEIDVSNLDI